MQGVGAQIQNARSNRETRPQSGASLSDIAGGRYPLRLSFENGGSSSSATASSTSDCADRRPDFGLACKAAGKKQQKATTLNRSNRGTRLRRGRFAVIGAGEPGAKRSWGQGRCMVLLSGWLIVGAILRGSPSLNHCDYRRGGAIAVTH